MNWAVQTKSNYRISYVPNFDQYFPTFCTVHRIGEEYTKIDYPYTVVTVECSIICWTWSYWNVFIKIIHWLCSTVVSATISYVYIYIYVYIYTFVYIAYKSKCRPYQIGTMARDEKNGQRISEKMETKCMVYHTIGFHPWQFIRVRDPLVVCNSILLSKLDLWVDLRYSTPNRWPKWSDPQNSRMT